MVDKYDNYIKSDDITQETVLNTITPFVLRAKSFLVLYCTGEGKYESAFFGDNRQQALDLIDEGIKDIDVMLPDEYNVPEWVSEVPPLEVYNEAFVEVVDAPQG